MNIERLRVGYKEILKGNGRWEWWVTCHLPAGLPDEGFQRYVKRIRYAFMKAYRGQVGYVGLYIDSIHHSPHFHTLWAGRFPGGETLRDLDMTVWRKKIGDIVHCASGVKIELVGSPASLERIINYMVGPRNILAADDGVIIGPWGRIAQAKTLEFAASPRFCSVT
ncbi:MAG: hypothetical protein PHT96_03160 [Syntrophorhabdaceae bacterium]|nr:hypothetical protein [Syntrophorhabdaceae bacterium]